MIWKDIEENLFRYSLSARFIPLVLSMEIFLFGYLFYFYPPYPFQRESFNTMPFFVQFKVVIVAISFIMAAWIFRFFSSMRFSFLIRKDGFVVLSGKIERRFSYDLIDSIDYENMLGPHRGLFGATIIRMRGKDHYRIFNVMNRGDRLVEMLVSMAAAKPFNRKDLQSWAEIRKISHKMGKSFLYISFWYFFMGMAFLFYMIKGYLM